MRKVLIVEPDRIVARCMKAELKKRSFSVEITANADQAIAIADEFQPDIVITELSLAGHSGTEFLYEFRTYTDWDPVPIVVYSSIKLSDIIIESQDWKQLNIAEYLYKPEESLDRLGDILETLVTV